MALQKDYPFRGVTIQNAYLRIVRISNAKEDNRCDVVLHVYQSKAAAEPENIIDVIPVMLPYVVDATTAWAYDSVKALPEFSGAVDV